MRGAVPDAAAVSATVVCDCCPALRCPAVPVTCCHCTPPPTYPYPTNPKTQHAVQDFDEKVRAFAAEHYNLSPEQVSSRLPRIYTSKEQLSEHDFIAVYKVGACWGLATAA